MVVIAALLLSLAGGVARADSVTFQFFLGGFDDVPEGSRGILVADTNGDGFDAVYLAAVAGTPLQPGTGIAGSDDIIVAVTESTAEGFAGGAVGFFDIFSGIDYELLGVAEGDPVRFFWFAEGGGTLTEIPSQISFASFREPDADLGGDLGYALPPAPGVYTLSHLRPEEGGATDPIAVDSGVVGPIVTQPVGGSFAGGDTATLTVGTQGSAALSYAWYEGQPGDTSRPVGSNSSSLLLDSILNDASYWVRVSDGTGSVDSVGVDVTVSGGGLRPEFTWDAISGAEWYQLYIQKDGRLLMTQWVEGNANTTWVPTANLGAGNYSWWVRGWSENGGYTGWSGDTIFSLGVPEMLTPTGKQEEGQWRPEITWTRSLGAEWYHVYIQRNGGLWQAFWLEGGATDSWTPVNDLPMGDYKVWVAPWSASNNRGPYSAEPASFSIGLPEPLGPSGEIGEPDNAAVDLTWNISSKNDWVQVYLQRNNVRFQTRWIESPAENWTPDPSLPSGDYKWWIQGWNAQDLHSPWVAGPDFSIDGLAPLSPSGSVTGTSRPSFTWASEPGTEWYRIYLARNGVVVFYDWIQDSSWVPDFDLSPGDHSWWIQSWRSDTGIGSWIGPVDFTLE